MATSNFLSSFWDRWAFLSSSSSDKDLGLIALSCWVIWNDKNNASAGIQIPNKNVRSSWIVKYMDCYLIQRSKAKEGTSTELVTPKGSLIVWKPPPKEVVKLNVDAAWSSDPSTTGMGAILRDWTGQLIGASARFVDLDFSPPLAEILAIWEGLKFAVALNLSHLIVESDCLQAINLLNSDGEGLCAADCWLEDIKNFYCFQFL